MTLTATAYETVIGLEVHAQLMTKSKMFCACPTPPADAPPNTYVCPVCLGMPGVLPVINEQALEYTVMTGLALNCEIPEHSKFDRKNYHYPDLMKGYQISQYDQPLCLDGWLEVEVDGVSRRVGITRVHLEEDTARSQHLGADAEGYSLIDVNRSGVPLMEIVSEPDMRSPEEARAYLVKLRQILRYIGTSNANMEDGNFRCDANVSLRPAGSREFGVKVEVKNMNSFRAVFHALEYEMKRQADMLDRGDKIAQETRGWVDADGGRTVSQRSKEFAHDYRYFPEPDLPPIRLSREQVAALRSRLPELPDAKLRRFMDQFGLSAYEANLLTESQERAQYFERAVAATPADSGRHSKQVANWMLGELARLEHASGQQISEIRIQPAQLSALIALVETKAITQAAAKQALEHMFATGQDPAVVIKELNLSPISGESELASVAARVIASNEKAIADYCGGKPEALQFLVGQFMRETKGRANPAQARELLQARIQCG